MVCNLYTKHYRKWGADNLGIAKAMKLGKIPMTAQIHGYYNVNVTQNYHGGYHSGYGHYQGYSILKFALSSSYRVYYCIFNNAQYLYHGGITVLIAFS